MKILPTYLEYSGSREGLTIEAFIPFQDGINKIGIMKELHLSEYDFPSKAIIKCSHCGQWAAVKTACKSCGAPVG